MGGCHKASVFGCLPLAAPIGLSPLLILTLCGSERVLVVSTEPPDDLSCLTTSGVGRPGDRPLPRGGGGGVVVQGGRWATGAMLLTQCRPSGLRSGRYPSGRTKWRPVHGLDPLGVEVPIQHNPFALSLFIVLGQVSHQRAQQSIPPLLVGLDVPVQLIRGYGLRI